MCVCVYNLHCAKITTDSKIILPLPKATFCKSLAISAHYQKE